MAQDWKTAQEATHPFVRRRDALAQEHARNTAAAAASTPRPPHSPSPFVISTLKTCVCGARPRYGYDEHVKHCVVAQRMQSTTALAVAQPVTAVEVVEAIVSARVETDPGWAPSAKIGAKGNCPKCGKYFERGMHLHARACKG